MHRRLRDGCIDALEYPPDLAKRHSSIDHRSTIGHRIARFAIV
jgi:hypothetical protein